MFKQPNFEAKSPENEKDLRTHYEVLGVSENATKEEIDQALRDLAARYHPDTNNNEPAAEAEMKRITEARAELTDPVKRATYDQKHCLGAYRTEKSSAQTPPPPRQQYTKPDPLKTAAEVAEALDGFKSRLRIMTKYEYFSNHLPRDFKDDRAAMERLRQWGKDFKEGLKRADFDYVAADVLLDTIIDYPPKQAPAAPTAPQTPPAAENPTAPDATVEPAVPPVTAPNPNPNPEPAKDPVVPPVIDPTAPVSPDPVKDPVTDPVKDPVKDPTAPAAKVESEEDKAKAKAEAEAAAKEDAKKDKKKKKGAPRVDNTVYNIADWAMFTPAEKKGYYEQTIARLNERRTLLMKDVAKNAALIEALNLWLFDFGSEYKKEGFDAVASRAAFDKVMKESDPGNLPDPDKTPDTVSYNQEGFAVLQNPGAEPITTVFRKLEKTGDWLLGTDAAGKVFLVDATLGTALSSGYASIDFLSANPVATDRTGFRRLLDLKSGKPMGSFYQEIVERDGRLIACEGGKFEKVLSRRSGRVLSRPYTSIFMKDGQLYGKGVSRDELIDLDEDD